MRWPAIALVICASPLFANHARADLRFAIANDVFTAADPIGSDDNGFTNDLDLAFWRPWREYQLGGRIYDRWITEETFVGGRRRDILDLLATAERTWGPPERSIDAPHRPSSMLRGPAEPGLSIVASARFGPTFTGNLGGRWMQNAFHTSCGCGRSLSEGLQNTYEGDNAVGVLAGAHAVASYGAPIAQAYVAGDGQLSLGTGVSSIDGAIGGRVMASSGDNRFGVHVELAVARFHVGDDRLAIPGSYRPGFYGTWRAGLHYARWRIGVDFEYHANEGNSGQPIGILAFTFKQAGTTF